MAGGAGFRLRAAERLVALEGLAGCALLGGRYVRNRTLRSRASRPGGRFEHHRFIARPWGQLSTALYFNRDLPMGIVNGEAMQPRLSPLAGTSGSHKRLVGAPPRHSVSCRKSALICMLILLFSGTWTILQLKPERRT